ncbi:MAG: hypothetical protein ACRDGS_10965 [Chloroflexota bacterium]
MTRLLPWRRVSLGLIALALLAFGALPAAIPTVHASGANIKLSRGIASAGDTVGVSGYGFTPSDLAAVYVTFNTSGGYRQIVGTGTVTGAGTFGINIAVPSHTYQGVYQVTAKDHHGHAASKYLAIVPVIHVSAGSAAASVEVLANHGFYVDGSGYATGEVVQVSASFPLYNGRTVVRSKNVTADSSGKFSNLYLQAPLDARAMTVTLTAKGTTSQKSGTAGLTVVYRPHISLRQSSLNPGQTGLISGRGFVPGAPVHVTATFQLSGGGTTTVGRTVRARNDGRFYGLQFPIPSNASNGKIAIAAAGVANTAHTEATVAVTYKPYVKVSSSMVRPGGTLSVSGGGFVPNTTVRVNVAVPQGGQTVNLTSTPRTNSSGTFTTQIHVPSNITPGRYALTATDSARNLHASTTATIAVHSTITVQPSSIRPGGAITVSGSGYGKNVSVRVYANFPRYGGGTKLISSSVQTGSNGGFRIVLRAPSHAAAGTVTVYAQGPHTRPSANLTISHLSAVVSVSPASAAPGSMVSVHGSGFLGNSRVDLATTFRLTNGSSKTVTTVVTTSGNGTFTHALRVPQGAIHGSYTLTARAESSGRSTSARIDLLTLSPTIIASPTAATPGAKLTVNGFGFASGSSVTVYFNGHSTGSATISNAGKFSTTVTVPTSSASGTFTLQAKSNSGRNASVSVKVVRQISTRAYFASIYTGTNYHEYLTFLNPSDTTAHATITYERTTGVDTNKAVVIPAHSRFTEDVNADIGAKVSTAAMISSDVAVAVERDVFHRYDGAVVPGVSSPANSWYFADGNTSHNYREFVAIQNPNSQSIRVAVRFLPTHHRAFTIHRTMPARSRTTVKVSSYVPSDAVGVTVTSRMPIVANRTIFVHNGMTSKIGARAPRRSFYIAGGPRQNSAHDWIGVINPTGRRVHLTLHAYGAYGNVTGTVRQWLRPYARKGYLVNKITGRADAAIVIHSSSGIVAEQTTYNGKSHAASTDVFGVSVPARSWMFSSANTVNSSSDQDYLDLFNPNNNAIPVAVQFFTSTGKKVQRTYTVGPHAHQMVNVNSVVPNAQLGIAATSSSPFVALNRGLFNHGSGGTTDPGIHMG